MLKVSSEMPRIGAGILIRALTSIRFKASDTAGQGRGTSARRCPSAGIYGPCSSTAPYAAISPGSSNGPDSASVGSRSITPCRSLRCPRVGRGGEVRTWVSSRRKNPWRPGQLSVEINRLGLRRCARSLDVFQEPSWPLPRKRTPQRSRFGLRATQSRATADVWNRPDVALSSFRPYP
jgi:hypothetical protein